MQNTSHRTEKTARIHQAAEQYAVQFERRLQETREKRKLSKYALEQLSGVSREMIDRIEQGKSRPTIFVIKRLAIGLGVTVSDLLTGLDG